MKTIVLKVSDDLKTRLDLKRSQGYSLNGLINALLQREFPPANGDRLDARHLSAAQIARLEEAMNSEDVELMVHTVDAMVGRQRATSTRKVRRRA